MFFFLKLLSKIEIVVKEFVQLKFFFSLIGQSLGLTD